LDILQVLNWLGFLSLGLLSITVPTYAISVAFLGRETRRSVWDRERKQKDLKKKLQAMSKQSEVGIEALRKEIDECQKDIDKLNKRSEQLSVKGAFIYPFASFAVAFASSVLGISVYQPFPSSAYSDSATACVVSALLVSYGGYRLYGSLCATNEAALSPETHAAMRVSFQSGSTAETFTHSQGGEVVIAIHNYGREMAEDAVVHLYFSPEFSIGEFASSEMETFVQGELADYPGHKTLSLHIGKLHADMLERFSVAPVGMPSRPGRYVVPVRVWEKRLGRSESALTFDVT
jgi:hypothetical protein